LFCHRGTCVTRVVTPPVVAPARSPETKRWVQ
jgi:hypothetical protein